MDDMTFNLGEYTTSVQFFADSHRILDQVDLAVFDENTWPLFSSYHGPKLVLPPGETSKHWTSVAAIMDKALELGLGRDSLIAGCGGGVLCDMTAFAASLYMRGCKVRLIPTTLLSMVDAALGGKTGIDYHGYKNLVGTFYPAKELYICPAFVATLPNKEFKSGLAEVIKSAMLKDAGLLELLEHSVPLISVRDPNVVPELIVRSLQVKGKVVEADLRETGERAFLNLGHTFAHALETVTNFKWSHGEAVVWGIAKALRLGILLGETPPAYEQRILNLLKSYNYQLIQNDVPPEDILNAMKNDKKKKAGKVRFILQKGPQSTFMTEVDDALVLKVLQLDNQKN